MCIRDSYIAAAKYLVFFDIISNMWFDNNLRYGKLELETKRTSQNCEVLVSAIGQHHPDLLFWKIELLLLLYAADK